MGTVGSDAPSVIAGVERVVAGAPLCDHGEAKQVMGGWPVPLSEDEQRILTEIEEQLYASDPGLARQVASTTVFSGPFRRTRWAIAGLIVGLALSLALLAVSPWASFVFGFGLMLWSGWYLERNLRSLGRVSIQQVAQTVRNSGMRDFFSSAGERARDRLHRDDQSGDDPDE